MEKAAFEKYEPIGGRPPHLPPLESATGFESSGRATPTSNHSYHNPSYPSLSPLPSPLKFKAPPFLLPLSNPCYVLQLEAILLRRKNFLQKYLSYVINAL